ncbi:TPA: hypothetical protein N0F65_012352 [Lagenidium giganteum]|uniref:Calcineurin-like phosphoesterase domain-containing protein n=1 Tax=Lagenidium giganteum TaxID=4803 RepID=A0AAV2YJP9_9STRA|nr:TPA: hypothetical protein N0F65_012352 [Lagenidium giganteum]
MFRFLAVLALQSLGLAAADNVAGNAGASVGAASPLLSNHNCKLDRTKPTAPKMSCASNRVRFIVIGDWGEAKDLPAVLAVRDGLLEAAKQSDFIISVGDNFYGEGVKDVKDPQWTSTWVNRFKVGKELQLPWLVALGNHDYLGNAQAQIDYSKINSNWIMPERMFTLDVETTVPARSMLKMVFADTNKWTASDLPWIQKQFDDPAANFVLAVGHHQMRSFGERGDSRDKEMKALNNAMIKSPKVKAYLCGHEHDMQYARSDNLDYFVIGGGGRDVNKVNNLSHKIRKFFRNPSSDAEGVYYAVAHGFAVYDVDIVTKTVDITYMLYEGGSGKKLDSETFSRQY